MSGNKAVVGVFQYMDDLIAAIKSAKEDQLEYLVYSPVPNHELEHVTYPKKSNVRVITLIGALSGLTFGFALAILCSLDWPLRVSAKDIISIPGFVVIGYECTILFGAIFTLLAMFHFAKIPNLLRKVGYDPRFSGDRFGIVVNCDTPLVEEVKKGLLDHGAEEVQVKDAM